MEIYRGEINIARACQGMKNNGAVSFLRFEAFKSLFLVDIDAKAREGGKLTNKLKKRK